MITEREIVIMADNDDKYTEGANEQQPSTSQSHSSTFTRTIVRNDECNEASSVESILLLLK